MEETKHLENLVTDLESKCEMLELEKQKLLESLRKTASVKSSLQHKEEELRELYESLKSLLTIPSKDKSIEESLSVNVRNAPEVQTFQELEKKCEKKDLITLLHDDFTRAPTLAESREHSNPFDDPFGLFYNFSDSSNNSYCKDLWNLDLFSETSTTILPKTTYEFKKIIKETSDDPFAELPDFIAKHLSEESIIESLFTSQPNNTNIN
ncbi:uncharacterized protein LOC135146388 [Zophobas morio]|uniref:uncharacterized protein LOC135146388 n=1 Tax=Zophobas morio TaxID=2755281 RepID=UPI003082D7EA